MQTAEPSTRTETVIREQTPEPPIKLTGCQKEAMELMSKGFTSKAAGALTGRSKKTMEAHLAHCRRKLGAMTTTEACCIAIRKGLIA